MGGKTTILLAVLLSFFGITIQSLFSFHEALQQTGFLIIGIVVYVFIVRKMHAYTLVNFSRFASIVGIVLLLLLLIAIDPIRGAKRWFTIGTFALQPSVIFVPFWIASYAELLTKYGARTLLRYIASVAVLLVPVFLIFRQPDLGTSIVVGISLFSVLLACRPRWQYIVGTVLCIIPFLFLSPLFLRSYQLTRLTAFMNETIDPSGANYNSIQAIIAIGSGGIFGKGFFNSTQTKLHFLPEAHTDFVFAAFTEMFGFIGSLLLITVGMLFLISIAKKISSHTSFLSRLFTVGVVTYVLTEWVFNIGMNLRLLPVVGVPLPLISYGGTAILTVFILLAMQRKFEEL